MGVDERANPKSFKSTDIFLLLLEINPFFNDSRFKRFSFCWVKFVTKEEQLFPALFVVLLARYQFQKITKKNVKLWPQTALFCEYFIVLPITFSVTRRVVWLNFCIPQKVTSTSGERKECGLGRNNLKNI